MSHSVKFCILMNIFLIFIFIGTVSADPTIELVSGSFANGQKIKITGSDFGSKLTAAPIKWDTFENGVMGGLLKNTDKNWVGYKDHDGALYSKAHSHSGSLSVMNSSKRSDFDTNHYSFRPSEEVYISYWWRTANVLLKNEAYYSIIKLSRITSSSVAGGGGVYNEAGGTTLGNMNPFYSSIPYCAYDHDGNTENKIGYLNVPFNNWVRIEMYKKVSTPGVADGAVSVESVGYGKKFNMAAQTRALGETFLQDTVMLGLEPANSSGGGEFQLHLDDMYIDNTRARVELGDNQTFDSCTHREIQIPVNWSNEGNLIEINTNIGTFKQGETAYLFVIDSDGSISNSYPITIDDDTLGTITLDAPVNLKIITE